MQQSNFYPFRSFKYYPHSLGISCAFRQWRATSHCNVIHGYSPSWRFDFAAMDLDANNWVMDFGSMKPVKQWLSDNFDHRLLMASDDPLLEHFKELHKLGGVNLNIVPATGCEAFSLQAFGFVKRYLSLAGMAPRIQLERATIQEHESNGASYSEPLIPSYAQPEPE